MTEPILEITPQTPQERIEEHFVEQNRINEELIKLSGNLRGDKNKKQELLQAREAEEKKFDEMVRDPKTAQAWEDYTRVEKDAVVKLLEDEKQIAEFHLTSQEIEAIKDAVIEHFAKAVANLARVRQNAIRQVGILPPPTT